MLKPQPLSGRSFLNGGLFSRVLNAHLNLLLYGGAFWVDYTVVPVLGSVEDTRTGNMLGSGKMQRTWLALLGAGIALPAQLYADVQIISEQAQISLFVDADGETDSIGRSTTANDQPPFAESLSLSNEGNTIQSSASGSLSNYSVSTANGFSLSATGAMSVSTDIQQSSATASGFSGFTIRFDIDRPAKYTAIGSLFKENASILGEDDTVVYAELSKVDPQSGLPQLLWHNEPSSGTLPLNLNGVLDGNSQYILTARAFGYVSSVWPDTPAVDNSGSFDIDFDFTEASIGDSDLDGDVDLNDLSTLASNYGTTGALTWAQGNFDFDNDVDLNDLSALAANYGLGEAQAIVDFSTLAAIPEPAMTMFLPIAFMTIRRRQR